MSSEHGSTGNDVSTEGEFKLLPVRLTVSASKLREMDEWEAQQKGPLRIGFFEVLRNSSAEQQNP
jgi:hypothetical protein